MKLILYNWTAILSINLILQVSYIISSEWELFLRVVLNNA